MKKQSVTPLTPDKQAEQLAGFYATFPDMASPAVVRAVRACGVTAEEAVRNAKAFAERMNPAKP